MESVARQIIRVQVRMDALRADLAVLIRRRTTILERDLHDPYKDPPADTLRDHWAYEGGG